jgi:hypothetical protein
MKIISKGVIEFADIKANQIFEVKEEDWNKSQEFVVLNTGKHTLFLGKKYFKSIDENRKESINLLLNDN